MEILLVVTLVLILGAEFVNGWTNAPNAIATVVSTRTLPPRVAVVCAVILNIAGAFFGSHVALTIGKGMVRADVINLETVSAAMVAIITWSVFAWRFGIPTSESHALIAGLSGAGLAVAGPSVLLWGGWSKVLWGLAFSSVIGFGGGWFVATAIQGFFARAAPHRARRNFALLQIVSSMFMAFSHGSNDGQKFIGAFSLALLLGGVTSSFAVPPWVIILCALIMGVGTSIGGLRIIKTMGIKMVRLETYQGFAAETAAASTILAASYAGIPLSTTHTISASIMGVGTARRKSAVRWTIVHQIALAWVLTFPICGAIAFAFLIHSVF